MVLTICIVLRDDVPETARKSVISGSTCRTCCTPRSKVCLFAYLLPFCLEAWRDDLSGIAGYGGFVEYFYPVSPTSRSLIAI